ncbi:zinc-dependent metalloprotease [Bacteroides ovatus]|nr:zinc-dependent metalloprotease [Bacteroides ovatus]
MKERDLIPRSQSEDLGDNNMKANEYGIKNLKRVMENILTWTAQPDGEYTDLTTIYNSVRAQHLEVYPASAEEHRRTLYQ